MMVSGDEHVGDGPQEVTADEEECDISMMPACTLPNAVLCEGWLRKQAHNFGRDWNRRYFVLTPHHLLYYYQPTESIARCQISLISASVKAAPVGDKLHMRRFRILTPLREYLLEAETVEEAVEWVSEIQSAIESRILNDCSGAAQQQIPLGTGLVVGSKQLRDDITGIAGNEACADCGVPNPSWVSTNLGVVLCIECSGVHRSLGCQVSRVRSLELDVFYPETIEAIKLLGNTRMNTIWEAEEDYAPRKALLLSLPSPTEERRDYIYDKYVLRSFTGQAIGNADAPLVSPRTLATLFSPELEVFDAVQTEDVAHTATLVFRYGVDVNICHGVTGWTPLHTAASFGQSLQVHFLVLNGANALAKDQQGRIPSEIALRSGYVELADHLMKYQKIIERGAKTTLGDPSAKGDPSSSQASMTLRIKEGISNL